MTSLAGRIGIGTVQFGLGYGLSNPLGAVMESEVKDILDLAASEGLKILDTAAAYGRSEQVLGSYPGLGGQFHLVTKIKPVEGDRVRAGDLEEIVRRFERSMEYLGVKALYGLLAHNINNLLAPGGDRVYEQMMRWKQLGLVGKIGVSAYDERELDRVLSKYVIDLVQVPINVLDQRLVLDGTLAELRRAGIEIHARSVFLQGLLLMKPSAAPEIFAPFRRHLDAFHDFLDANEISPVIGALAFVASVDAVSCAIVGVASRQQLLECISASAYCGRLDFKGLSCTDQRLLDPRCWGGAR